jgi:hypothetical protein
VERPPLRFPGPIYESLPWVYLGVGAAALAASYFIESMPAVSFLAGLTGFLGILAGAVILLRRRDYREMRQRYPHED